jgi:predicted RNase H-like nuclease
LSNFESVFSSWRPQLRDARFDVGFLALAADDDRRVLGRDHALRAAEHVKFRGLELEAEIVRDHLTAHRRRDVGEHLFLAIAVARRFDREHVERAAQLVEDKCRERLAVDIVGNDDEIFLAGLRDFFEQRKDVFDR